MATNYNDSIQKMVMNELMQGVDITKKLQSTFFDDHRPSNSARELVQKILTCFEKSIAILQLERVDSPPSFISGSPKSQDSEGDFKDRDQKDELKKRKVFPTEKRKSPGCVSSGLEQPVEDGYNWRKYGQKEILGAKYPRAYYRCTLRQTQECIATKQVQRIDDNPTFFDVTYRGTHTCSQTALSSTNPNPNPIGIKLEPYESVPCHHNEVIWSFKLDNQKSNNTKHDNIDFKSPPFSFPSSSNPITIPYNNGDFTNHGELTSSSLMVNDFDTRVHIEGETIDHGGNDSLVAMIPDYSFDQGEIDHDSMFDSPPFFP